MGTRRVSSSNQLSLDQRQPGRETRTPAMQAGLATRRLTLRDIFVSLRRVVSWLSHVLTVSDSRRTAAAAVMYMPVAA